MTIFIVFTEKTVQELRRFQESFNVSTYGSTICHFQVGVGIVFIIKLSFHSHVNKIYFHII